MKELLKDFIKELSNRAVMLYNLNEDSTLYHNKSADIPSKNFITGRQKEAEYILLMIKELLKESKE